MTLQDEIYIEELSGAAALLFGVLQIFKGTGKKMKNILAKM